MSRSLRRFATCVVRELGLRLVSGSCIGCKPSQSGFDSDLFFSASRCNVSLSNDDGEASSSASEEVSKSANIHIKLIWESVLMVLLPSVIKLLRSMP